jgi:hypothetical protein
MHVLTHTARSLTTRSAILAPFLTLGVGAAALLSAQEPAQPKPPAPE